MFARAAGTPPPEPFDYPTYLGLDHTVTGGQCGCNAVPAVPHDVHVAVTREVYRRRHATLLEPLPVPLYRRLVDVASATLTDPNVVERNPERCRRRSLLRMAPPFGE